MTGFGQRTPQTKAASSPGAILLPPVTPGKGPTADAKPNPITAPPSCPTQRCRYGTGKAEPAAVGAGSGDVAAVAFRVWKGDAKDPTVISLAALTAEAVAQHCKRMPEVQAWTNEAARSVGPLFGSPQAWGTAIHKQVETRIKALKDLLPPAYADIFAELSFDPDVGK